MSDSVLHSHVFLGTGHVEAERRTRAVVILCTAMMVVEIVGGTWFGSIALVADGLHMSTHAGALLLAALAYRYARHYARDPRFTFGTGKLGSSELTALVRKNFALTPKAIIESLKLRRPIYQQTAAYGHFGRNEADFTWEATDKAAALAEQAGLQATAK